MTPEIDQLPAKKKAPSHIFPHETKSQDNRHRKHSMTRIAASPADCWDVYVHACATRARTSSIEQDLPTASSHKIHVASKGRSCIV